MNFSKWCLKILHEIEYLVFHSYNVFFENKIIFQEFMFSGPISIRY
jgi:hypothetical protein